MFKIYRIAPGSLPDRIAQSLAGFFIDVVCAALIVFAGEAVFSSVARAWILAGANPAAFAVSSLVVLLCLRALFVFFSRPISFVLILGLVCLVTHAGAIKMAKLGAPLTAADALLLDQLWPVIVMFAGPVLPVIVAMVCTALGAWGLWKYRPDRAALRRIRASRISATSRLLGGLLAFALVLTPDFTGGDRSAFAQFIPRQLSRVGVDNYRYAPLLNVERNGQLLAFLFELRGVVFARAAALIPPEGYDASTVRAIVSSKQASTPTAAQATDIVVIMSEAWWDPGSLPRVHFNDPLLKQLRSTVKGELYAPTFGGYTVNAEFEFLSRLSTAFITPGSIPYQEYVTHPLPSLAADFGEAGYETIAIHPYDDTFWSRNTAYPRLGFSRFVTQDDFASPELVPPYISDRALADKIIESVKATPKSRHFIFAVSMQNHAPYAGLSARYAGATRVSVDDPEDRLDVDARDTLSTYASGVRDAVLAFNKIVAHFEKSSRPAVVVMFGDHLPYLGDRYDIYARTGFIDNTDETTWSVRDYHRMHAVPVVGWTNMPQGLALPDWLASPVFLGSGIKQAAGLPPSAIDRVLAQVAAERAALAQEGPEARTLASSRLTTAVANYRLLVYDQLSGRGYATCVLRPGLCKETAATKAAGSR